MNAKTLLIATTALALLGAGSAAFAQEASSTAWQYAPVNGQRADVVAAYQHARKNGGMAFAKAGYIEPAASLRNRAAVKAETEVARDTGELAAINAEVYAFNARPLNLAGKAR
jgi:Skp family chaperone for outer membrane proteins